MYCIHVKNLRKSMFISLVSFTIYKWLNGLFKYHVFVQCQSIMNTSKEVVYKHVFGVYFLVLSIHSRTCLARCT